jgi:DNA-binding transcriptional LysR family regulator
MDIRNFITFNTVFEAGGFTKASKKLNYAQSTVTLHIKELENHYRLQLFDRINKKIYLTSFGEQVYKRSKKLVEDYQTVLTLNDAAQTTEVLRIGVYESLLKYRLYPLIQEFKETHPTTDIIIQHGVCTDLRKLVRGGELDLSFQIETIREFSGLDVHILCPEDFKLILPKHQTMDFLLCEDHTVYLTEKDCSYRSLFEHYLDKEGYERKQVMETGSVDMIKQYVALGLGYSMVPSISLQSKEDKNTLEIIDIQWEHQLYTQLFYHKDKSIFPAMQDFLEIVMQHAIDWK